MAKCSTVGGIGAGERAMGWLCTVLWLERGLCGNYIQCCGKIGAGKGPGASNGVATYIQYCGRTWCWRGGYGVARYSTVRGPGAREDGRTWW